MNHSIYDQLEKTRRPRVHIKYEIETEGTTTQKELPFVVGVLGDFAGNSPGKDLKHFKERKFITIHQDNFDQVLKNINPGVNLHVENRITHDGSKLEVQLNFESLQDFEPHRIVEQVPVLRELKMARDRLRDLLSKTDRSDELELILEETLQNKDTLQELADQLGILDQKED